MACHKPLDGYRADPSRNDGKGGFTASRKNGYTDQPMQVPCGRCIGCRLEHSRQWAVRCTHEASMYEDSCFVTLTYDDEHLPYRGSLVRKDIQDFHKRLKKKVPNLRYFYCGEYGEDLERPHFHALYFGFDPSDKYPWRKNSSGEMLYRSPLIENTWGKGQCENGFLTFESAAYVARYVTKKITGDLAEEHYKRVDEETGEVYHLEPEFVGMSLKPGIGYDYCRKYLNDIYSRDSIYIRNSVMKPPRYYDKVLEQQDPNTWEKIQAQRRQEQSQKEDDPRKGTFNLYNAKHTIAEQRLQQRKMK